MCFIINVMCFIIRVLCLLINFYKHLILLAAHDWLIDLHFLLLKSLSLCTLDLFCLHHFYLLFYFFFSSLMVSKLDMEGSKGHLEEEMAPLLKLGGAAAEEYILLPIVVLGFLFCNWNLSWPMDKCKLQILYNLQSSWFPPTALYIVLVLEFVLATCMCLTREIDLSVLKVVLKKTLFCFS